MAFTVLQEDGGKLLLETSDKLKAEFYLKNIIGEEAWHVFTNGIDTVIVGCTLQEYGELIGSNQPTLANHTWERSYKDWRYDTPSGKLEDNCYVNHGGAYLIKEAGQAQEWVNEF